VKGFAEEMAQVFPTFDDEEALECLTGDFAELGAEEAVRGFRQAEAILEGLMRSAESIGVPIYVALSEAKSRVKEARYVARRWAERYEDN
jgi:hypothetical protein